MSDYGDYDAVLARLIQLVVDAQPAVVQVDGVSYTRGKLTEVRPSAEPLASTLEVATLGGLVDYLSLNRDGLDLTRYVLHVVSAQQVDILGPLQGREMSRERPVSARCDDLLGGARSGSGFSVGQFYALDDFVVRLQSCFELGPGGDRAAVLRVAGNAKDEAVRTVSDDGVTQEVSARSGVLVEGLTVPNPVTLYPYRCFREVPQPGVSMVFRMKREEGGVRAALFEADGGDWRRVAVERIQNHLVAALEERGLQDVGVLA